MKIFKRHYLERSGFPVEQKRPTLIPVFYWILIILGIFVIQTNVTFFDLRLNLTILVPFYVGLRISPERGLLMGMVVGLIEDSLSNTIIGPNLLSKGMVGLIAPLISGRFFIWTPFFGVGVLFMITFFDGIVVYGCRSLFLIPPAPVKDALVYLFFQSLINSPVGFLIRPKDE